MFTRLYVHTHHMSNMFILRLETNKSFIIIEKKESHFSNFPHETDIHPLEKLSILGR